VTSYDTAERAFLKRAAEVILGSIRAHSPTPKSAASWRTEARGTFVYLRTRDTGTIATNQPEPLGQRHPVFGNRKVWRANNIYHPERTGFIGRAVAGAIDEAADAGTEEWLRNVVITSRYFTWYGGL
jgi:hypothetical protein